MSVELLQTRWLFFDLGNTLINEEKPIEHRIHQMAGTFAERSIQVSAEAVRRAFQEASAEFAPRLIVRAVEKLADDPVDRAYILQEVRYRKELEEPYPEAFELLRNLEPRYGIGIIANQSAGTEGRLERYGLSSFISICLSSAEIGLEKPDPAIFQLALKQVQCKPHQAVMIGDRLDNDIRPAKSLGWRTIRVLQGFAKVQIPRDSAEEPDFTVTGLSEIMTILSQGTNSGIDS